MICYNFAVDDCEHNGTCAVKANTPLGNDMNPPPTPSHPQLSSLYISINALVSIYSYPISCIKYTYMLDRCLLAASFNEYYIVLWINLS